jgi:outer membrane protein insertion porin family
LRSRVYIYAFSITILCLSGCIPTRYLGKEEKLLVSISPKGLDRVDPVAIQDLYQQEPNRLVLGSAPYLALYNFGKKFYDPQKIQVKIEEQQAKQKKKIQEAGTDSAEVQKMRAKFDSRIESLQEKKKEGNFLMQIGEPPAIYDSVAMGKTMDQIAIYLNSKGYFNHQASYSKEIKKEKLVYIKINIDENIPYRYAGFSYNIPDTAISNIVKNNSNRSNLQLGDIYDEERLSQERDRLYDLLKNRGYYDFARAYIEFEVDTSFAQNAAHVKTIIQNPDQGTHRVYKVNNVFFKSDMDRFGIPRDTISYKGVDYVAYRHKYSPEILDKKIDIYPGQPYSQLLTATTQRKLSNLDVFQFNNVLYRKLPANDTSYLLNAYINAVPSKKFQETTELGMNFTERRPGPFSRISLRVRNVFGGAENLDIALRGGYEAQIGIADDDQTVMIKEFGGNVALSFPVILVPFTNKNLLADFSPRTRFYSGYTNEDRREYQRSNYELGLDYIWQRARRPLQPPIMQYIFSPLNLNIVQVGRISDAFQNRLQQDSLTRGNRSLSESFKSAFISFVSFNFIYNTNDFTQSKNARYFRLLTEVGGLTQELGLNVNIGDLRTFQYAKINPDYRRYIPLGNQRVFAYRINTGVASPLLSSNVLPYDKHFFAGGASSVRAWQSRRLGLGSFPATSTVDGEDVVLNEQPGEVLVEGSMEYRFNMFSFLNGAFFVDAGNVWLLEKDTTRPGANFELNRFYKELAVGTGFGIRFDLSVVVLRFDLATKVYDPTVAKGSRFVFDEFKFTQIFTRNNQTSLNIGIGYPF